MWKINSEKFNKYFGIYLLILGTCAIIALYFKSSVANDSTISEWLINYQGGLIRRGLLGEISFQLASILDLELRTVIFYFQTSAYLFFLFLNYIFFKSFRHNILTLFAIFTPIFLLYPVAEIEVLARKEIFLYIYFFGIYYISLLSNKSEKILNYYILLVTPLICMIWELMVLFFPFIVGYLVFLRSIKSFQSFFKICLLFIPSILIVIYFFAFPVTKDQHLIMQEILMTDFGEKCYMSCQLLRSRDINSFGNLFYHTLGTRDFNDVMIWITRYTLILIVGFSPLFIISYFSNIKENNIFTKLGFKNLFFLILFLCLFSIPLFPFASDWGRWVGIMISFSTYFYFFLYKESYLLINETAIEKKISFFQDRKKLLVVIFILFAFGWNQKTAMSGDVATNPLWKVPYNTVKKVFGLGSIRIFQDSTIIRWHKKYIE